MIYDHFVPKTVVASAPVPPVGRAVAAGTVDPDIERVSRAIEKAARHSSKDSEDVFNITLLPEEVKNRFILNNLSDKITLKRNLKQFKNSMTKHNGSTLPRNFVRVPNDTYASYIIMFNGTAFRYLKNQTDKQREVFIKKFSALTE